MGGQVDRYGGVLFSERQHQVLAGLLLDAQGRKTLKAGDRSIFSEIAALLTDQINVVGERPVKISQPICGKKHRIATKSPPKNQNMVKISPLHFS